MACLWFPGLATVGGGDDRSERADRPTKQWILRRKSHREEMIAHAARAQHPFRSAVVGGQHDAARAGNNDSRTILDVKSIKRCIGGAFLFFPLKAAVVRRQHNSV